MIKVGLTGGIGSGKSTVADFFSELGVPVYNADFEAKKLMNTSKIIKKKLIAEFGLDVFREGILNRAYLAAIVFKDKKKLNTLNNIVHPKLTKHFSKWALRQVTPYVIQENAIIFENNKADEFDYIIAITAPKTLRIERVIKRDTTHIENVLARMNNQWDEAKKNNLSDFVINNVKLSETKKEVGKIHKELLKLVRAKKGS